MFLFAPNPICRPRLRFRGVPAPSRLRLAALLALLAALFSGPLPLLGQTAAPPASASEAGTRPGRRSPEFWENRGRWNFGLQLGYAVENAIPRNISHVNLLIVQPQAGLIAYEFRRGPVSRFEILTEGILGSAVHPGGHLLGTSLFFRFDGNPRGRWVPFFDAGAGILHTTLATRAPELSGNLQFLPQGGLGVHYFIRPQRALIFEYRYIHMSNAGIEPPNHGFNASMITVGFRWLRRP